MTLSPQQAAIVDFVRHGKGSLNVVARAGCGKTYTIVNGAIATIYNERPKEEVVVMSYNKAAGNELKARLEKAGLTDWRRVQAGTCHSFGFAAFRKLAPNVKVDSLKVAKIIDNLAGPKELNPDHIYRRLEGPIKTCVSLAKGSAFGFLTPIENTNAWFNLVEHFGLDEDLPEGFSVGEFIRMCKNVLEESISYDYDVIDFDDMILAPLIHKARFWGKHWVIIDEGQDTNPARRALALAMLKAKTGRLMVVGDDRQAINGYTGADNDAMDIIAKQMGAVTLPLTVTYRCPKAVVRLAQNLVRDFTAHPSAPEGVVRKIRGENWFKHENLGYGDAIICRNNRPLIDLAYQLIRNGIGCMVEGRDIGKDMVALATRWSRVNSLSALSAKLEEHREREVTKWLAKGREEKADAVEDKVGTIQSLIEKLTAEGKAHVHDLIASIESLFGDSTDKTAPKVLLLCSAHRSKGREWRRVYGYGRERFMPSKYARKAWQLTQEENLEYVSITRAMEEYIDVVVSDTPTPAKEAA